MVIMHCISDMDSRMSDTEIFFCFNVPFAIFSLSDNRNLIRNVNFLGENFLGENIVPEKFVPLICG
jgi:hypothetical protein